MPTGTLYLHTPFNCLPNLLWLRPRNTLLNIPVFENTKRRHLTNAQFLRYIFAFFNVVRVEFDLVYCASATSISPSPI
jgi:hypothetical protein